MQTIPVGQSDYPSFARASNTERAYDADWRHFAAWCTRHGVVPCPVDPRHVARYLVALVNGSRSPDGGWLERPRRIATLERRLAAIRQRHRIEGVSLDLRDPVLADTWRGIRRSASAASQAKEPTVTEFVRALVEVLPHTMLGIRDRALLLIGFAGAFRRSELVDIDHEDCALHADGIVISLGMVAGDPEHRTHAVAVPYGLHRETCPVHALTDWLTAAAISDGPLFRPVTRYGSVLPQRLAARSVALIVKRTVQSAQDAARAQGNDTLAQSLDPARYAANSLRSGFIISAAAAGVSERDIMRHTRHWRVETLEKYTRQATLFRHNAAAKVGL